jgi:hypothetical protein
MKYIGTGLDINIFFVQTNYSKISKVIVISHSRMYIPQQEGMSQKNIVINNTITRKKERNRTRVYGQASKQPGARVSLHPFILLLLLLNKEMFV